MRSLLRNFQPFVFIDLQIYRSFLIGICLLLFALQAKTQVALPGANVLVDQVPSKRAAQLWRFNLNLSYSSTLFNAPDSAARDNDFGLQGGIFYLGAPDFNVILSSSINYNSRAQNWDEGFFSIRLNRKKIIHVTDRWKGIWGLSVIIPTGATGYRTSLITALAGHLNLFSQGYESFSFFTTYSLTRFIHEYDTSITGMPNTQWSHRLHGNMNYTMNSYLFLSFNLGFRQQLTYQNTIRENIYHSQEVSYLIDNQKSLSLGHTWGDNLLSIWNSNGDFNLGLWDEKNSMVYISYGMSL